MESKTYVVKNQELNIEKIEETINEILESNNKLKASKSKLYKEEINSLLTSLKKSNKAYERKIKSSILSIILSISISIGGVISINNAVGNHLMYKTTEYTYADDNVTQEEKRGNFNNVLIKEYGYWNEEGTERINKVYDVSEYTFEDIKDYLNIDLTSLEFDTETDYVKNYNNLQDITNEGKKALIKNVSEKDFSITHFSLMFFVSIVLIYANTLLFNLIYSVNIAIKEKKLFKNFNIHKPSDIYEKIVGDLLEEKCNIFDEAFHSQLSFMQPKYEKTLIEIDQNALEDYLEEMKKPLNEILSEIEKNNELRNEFVRLFNENIYLLNDPNLLLEKYNEALKEYDLLTDLEYANKTRNELKQILK